MQEVLMIIFISTSGYGTLSNTMTSAKVPEHVCKKIQLQIFDTVSKVLKKKHTVMCVKLKETK